MANLTKRIFFTLTATLAAGAATVATALSGAENQAPKVGEIAPDWTLTDTTGAEHSLKDFRGKVVVLEWFNPDCPFVKKFHKNSTVMAETVGAWNAELDANGEVVARGKDAEAHDLDVVFIAINSGAQGKQGHGADRNTKAIKDYKMQYPVLLDEKGVVGRMYGAKKTPEIFIIDEAGEIIYHGPIDNNGSARTIGDMNYLSTALAQHAKGETIVRPEIKPYGCRVKYNDKTGG